MGSFIHTDLVEGNEGFRVDSNEGETGPIAKEQLRKEAEEDCTDCLVLQAQKQVTVIQT